MANRILMMSMNPPHGARTEVARLHRWRYAIRYQRWSSLPLTPAWKERADKVMRRLGSHFDYTNRWLILAAERMADTLRR